MLIKTELMNIVKKISSLKSFQSEVIASKGLTVVEFATEWSGTSQMVAPIFKDLANKFSSAAKFCLVSIDESQEFENEFEDMSVPSILFFINGDVVDKIKGSASRERISEKIETLLQSTVN